MEHLSLNDHPWISIFLHSFFKWNHIWTLKKTFLHSCLDYFPPLYCIPSLASCSLLQEKIWQNEERGTVQPLFLLDEVQTSIPWNVSYLDDCMKISLCLISFFPQNFISLGKTTLLHRSWNSIARICNLPLTFQKHSPKHFDDPFRSLFDHSWNHIFSTL